MKQLAKITLKELFLESPAEEDAEHYGILGQKWGVRRYQNEDGSLTPEGKARYGGDKSYDSKSNTWKSKDARHLSDEELNRRNSRLQRERQYKDLTEPPIRKEVKSALKKILIGTAIGVAAAAMTKNYKTVLDKGQNWLKGDQAKAYMWAIAKAGKAKWLL